MEKAYYLKYGSKLSKEEIKELFDKYNMSFTQHDGFYFGVYFYTLVFMRIK